MSFRWFQRRSSSSRIVRARGQVGCRAKPERVLARVGVGDAVRDGACGAGALCVGKSLVERVPFGGALEAAVLVEEPCVDVEDAVADDVEAEVPRLDDAGVDRADGDLVGVVPVNRDRPAAELEVVVDERPQRLVAVEADAVEVGRLALVPAGRAVRSTIVGTRPFSTTTVSSRTSPSGAASAARTRAPAGRGVQAGEAPGARRALRRSAARYASLIRHLERVRGQSRCRAARTTTAVSPSRQTTPITASAPARRRIPATDRRSRRRAPAGQRLDQRLGEAEEAQSRAARRRPRPSTGVPPRSRRRRSAPR